MQRRKNLSSALRSAFVRAPIHSRALFVPMLRGGLLFPILREYHPTLEPPYRWRDWAAEGWPAERLLEFVHGRLIPYLQTLGGDPSREAIRSVFAEHNAIVCASGYNPKDVLSIVNGIDFHSREDLETHPIPLLPLPEERRIVAYLETVREPIRAIKEAQAETEAALRRLERAVLEQAFRGEL